MTIEALRTPEDRFADLPDFPYRPRYLSLADFPDLRLAMIDEGPGAADTTFLCLHGQPTWSYLYRRMIPPFLGGGGARVVAPDFFGFGRSDKPLDEVIYTFDFHRRSLIALIETLDLRRIILVCQDWGGLLGLTLPMDMPERFAGLIVMNTTLATGDAPLSEGFLAWRAWSNANPDMAVGRLIGRACPHLTPAEVAAYDAPFPDARFKAGVRRFPNLVPDSPDAPGAALSRRAHDWWRQSWSGRSFMAIGAKDPVLGEPVMRALHRAIRGCPEPLLLPDAGHFAQEWGEQIVGPALRALNPDGVEGGPALL